MSANINKSELLSFYFGSLTDDQRLQLEREMLIDTEMLLDYFDLKRELEDAKKICPAPTPQLRRRIESFLTEKGRPRRRLTFIAAGIAASLILATLWPKIWRNYSSNTLSNQQIHRIFVGSAPEQNARIGVF